jgi:hypothetical protein
MKRAASDQSRQGPDPSVAGKWRGSLSATACTWRKEQEASQNYFPLLAAGGFALFTLVLMAPVYFLGLGLASLAAFVRGFDPAPPEVLSDPALWIPLVGSSAVAGLLILFLSAKSFVIAFTFDAATKQLEYIEKRWLQSTTTKRVPFGSIVEVVPILMTTYATAGHFEVRTNAPGDRHRSLWLGDDIPLPMLEAHREWLYWHLGERALPVLRQDC